MAILIHHSPLNFFDRLIGDYYRQMATEMDQMREQMFQLLPPEFPVASMRVPGELHDHEPLVPVVEENGERKMRLEFNVKNYKPEEVKVKILNGNVLQVHAEHEEKSENGEVKRQMYVRRYRLPKAVDVEHIRSSLSKDGVLSIEAPTPGLAPTERLIPIQYQPGDEQSQAAGGSTQ